VQDILLFSITSMYVLVSHLCNTKMWIDGNKWSRALKRKNIAAKDDSQNKLQAANKNR